MANYRYGGVRLLQKWTGFRDPTKLLFYSILSCISLAFTVLVGKSMFVTSAYCNPDDTSAEALPGECYWFMKPGSLYYWGIQLHLSTCFPALVLAIFQFTPSIRQNFPQVHRWMGRLTMTLSLITTLSALLFANVAVGSTSLTYYGILMFVPLSLFGHFKAWTSVRAQEYHNHRRWILRTWFWLGSIITMRPVLVGCILAFDHVRGYLPASMSSLTISCERLLDITVRGLGEFDRHPVNILTEYTAECLQPALLQNRSDLIKLQNTLGAVLTNRVHSAPPEVLGALREGASVNVPASLVNGRIDQATAVIDLSFGPAVWMGFLLHVVIIEWYLLRTKNEDSKLRALSKLRQKKREKKEEIHEETKETALTSGRESVKG